MPACGLAHCYSLLSFLLWCLSLKASAVALVSVV